MSSYEKSLLRKRLLEIRSSLKEAEKDSLSEKIKQNLFGLTEFKSASSILFYASFTSEVETFSMLKETLDKKRCFLPKVFKDELKIFEIQSLSDLNPGYCGILEPVTKREVGLEEADLIIVPGLAFSRDGGRLGYGKGFYDRLLTKTSSMKVGLCFSCQLTDKIPMNQQDQKMDRIITEDEIIYCTIQSYREVPIDK
jgi:5-formyltetrahydrofolate cyclo-ligase